MDSNAVELDDVTPTGTTPAPVEHRYEEVNGTRLHYVSAGTGGSSVLLVHGFPESWYAFHKLIPRLPAHHRVVAVDLGGSATRTTRPAPTTARPRPRTCTS